MPILTKRERQDAKLTLAGTDRRARNLIEPGRYNDVSADATQLPTRYAVGDNTNLVINPNISGLYQVVLGTQQHLCMQYLRLSQN